MSDEYLKFDIASIRARDEKYRTIAELDKNDCPREDRLELLVLHDALAAENARLRARLADCELALDVWDTGRCSEYWLRVAVQPPEERT